MPGCISGCYGGYSFPVSVDVNDDDLDAAQRFPVQATAARSVLGLPPAARVISSMASFSVGRSSR